MPRSNFTTRGRAKVDDPFESAASTPRRFFQAHRMICAHHGGRFKHDRRRVFFVWSFGAAESRILEK